MTTQTNRNRQIPDDVLSVLSRCAVDGPRVVLPEQLDRKLYLRVNEVLAALGGAWQRKAKAHVFDTDAAERLDHCILTGSYARPQDFGFFPTPAGVADLVAELADLRLGHLVLEPSAGTGALVEACLRSVSGLEFHCFEIQPDMATSLNARWTTTVGDFLQAEPEPHFDRVVMNPPFARGQDVDHVRHALKFLRPGGRLVSVMSASVEFRQDRRYASFREECAPELRRLPPGSFRPSGTDVHTVVAVVEG